MAARARSALSAFAHTSHHRPETITSTLGSLAGLSSCTSSRIKMPHAMCSFGLCCHPRHPDATPPAAHRCSEAQGKERSLKLSRSARSPLVHKRCVPVADTRVNSPGCTMPWSPLSSGIRPFSALGAGEERTSAFRG